MSVGYRAVQWDGFKQRCDLVLGAGVASCVGAFAVGTLATHPGFTVETLIIRASAVSAFALLHVILCIGPLARLDAGLLPLLYNRRHLGVTMFLLAAIHAGFSTIQFHGFTDENAVVSVFTAYWSDYNPGHGFAQFPFEPLGAAALAILFLMAATSHDFWLRNLGASVWKTLHLGVHAAYGLVLAHVALGALQSERAGAYPAIIAAGFAVVVGLHLAAWRREGAADSGGAPTGADGFVATVPVTDLREGIGRTVPVEGRRVALFLHEGRVFATSNVCRHQGGPIGEGRIVDGCITCPWHGWTYQPADGKSPPPFKEVLPTHEVRIVAGMVHVRARENEPGTSCRGAVACR